jgi:hypothetical protein
VNLKKTEKKREKENADLKQHPKKGEKERPSQKKTVLHQSKKKEVQSAKHKLV